MSTFLLAIAFALAPMTATRNGGPVGPTDILLAIASAISIARALITGAAMRASAGTSAGARDGADAARPVLLFWLAALPLALVSTLLNWNIVTAFDPQPMVTLSTYVASAILILALFMEGLSGHLRSFMVASNAIALVITIVYLVGYLVGYEPFFFYFRFVGFSENPNQTALHMLSFIVVAMMTLTKLPGLNVFSRVAAIGTLALAFLLGILSDSDAFKIAAVATVAGVAAFFLVSLFRNRSPWAAVIALFGLPALACLGIILHGTLADVLAATQSDLTFGNQDVDRYTLWNNGIQAWLAHPLIGNGVGAWSGFVGPFNKEEVHNSVIDWLTITGLAGFVVYLAMLTAIFRRPPFRYVATYFGLLALLTFSMFHFTFRQPSFWLCFVTIFLRGGFIDPSGRDEERFSKARLNGANRGARIEESPEASI